MSFLRQIQTTMPYGNNDSPPPEAYITRPAPAARLQASRSPSLPDSPIFPRHSHHAKHSSPDPKEAAPQNDTSLNTQSSPESPEWSSLLAFTTRRHTSILFFCVICSIVAGSAPALHSYLIGRIFAVFSVFGAGTMTEVDFEQQLKRYNIYLLLLGIFCWAFSGSMFAGWKSFGALQARSAREILFNGLVNLPMSWFDQRQDGVGALTTQMQGLIKDLETSTAHPLGMIIRDTVSTLLCFSLAFYASWRLTLMMLGSIPIIAMLMSLFSSRIQPNFDRQTQHLSTAAKHVTNAFSVIDTVKCYNGHLQEEQRYSKFIDQAARHYFHQANWHALQSSMLRLITLGMFIQGFWYGSTLIGNGTESAGTVFTAFWSCLTATSSLMQIASLMMSFEKGKLAGSRLRALIAAPSKPLASSLRQSRSHTQSHNHDINFNNVWFSYPTQPDQMVLQGVNLSFVAGDFTFMVGKSGSGKSTVGQLLTKIYPPLKGTISLGDSSLHSIDSSWICNNILLVEQQSLLFNTTIKENIALGRGNSATITMKEIEEAAEFSSIGDAILEMPDGFATIVGYKGAALSGGQVQRVALARARLRDPPILILDESTSALDQIGRLAVMNAIRQWRKGKTTIVITHDISQIHPDDFVYVMSEGKVVEEGFRKALAKSNGSLFIELAKSINPPAHFGRFTSNTLANLGKRNDQHAECMRYVANLHQRTLNSRTSLNNDQGNSPRIGRWFSSFGPTLITGWTPRQSLIVSPQSPRPHPSPVPSTLNTLERGLDPKSGLLPPHRSSAGPTAHFEQVVWPRAVGQNQSQPSIIASRTKLETLKEHLPEQQHSSRPESLYKAAGDATRVQQGMSENHESSEWTTKLAKEENRIPEYTISSILATVWPSSTYLDRSLLLLGFAAALAFAASTPVFAFAFSKLIHTFYNSTDRKAQALKYSLAILAIAVGGSLMMFLGLSLVQRVGQSWVSGLRKKAFHRILDQPREFFDREENGVSHMAICLDHHAEAMQHILGRFAGNIMIAIAMVTIAIIWSLISCWKLTLVMIACTPAILIISNFLATVSSKMETQSANEEEHAASIFAEVFNSIKTVRALTLENWFVTKHQVAVEDVLKTEFKKGLYIGTFLGLSQAALFSVTALVFHYGGLLIRSHQYDLKNITQVFTLLLFSISTATLTLASIPQLSTCRESSDRLLRLANLPKDSHEADGKNEIQSAGDIIFRNVYFRYSSRANQLILNGLNLKIQAGTSIALVGVSGSGKSTIASLLVKLYSPTTSDQENSILTISGHDIKNIHTPTLRNLIAIVSQTPALFPASISANIVYGLPRLNPLNNASNVRRAAMAAGIHDFISSLPNGYDTVIGDGGMGLSGGQAQRIAIARALARRPEVLILDEATSALDQECASVISESILKLRKEQRRRNEKVMTVIIITHVKEMMKVVDKVVMLDEGSVVEEGKFEDLVRRNGKFASLIRGQVWERERERVERRSILLMERAVGVNNRSAFGRQ